MERFIQELIQEISTLSSLQFFSLCFVLLALLFGLIYMLFLNEIVSQWYIKRKELKQLEKLKKGENNEIEISKN